MIYDIVSSEEDLDHRAEAQKSVYIIMTLFVDVDGQVRSVQYYWAALSLGWLLECIPNRTMSPGGFAPPRPPPIW